MAIHSLAGVPLMRGSSSRLAAAVIIAAHNSQASRRVAARLDVRLALPLGRPVARSLPLPRSTERSVDAASRDYGRLFSCERRPSSSVAPRRVIRRKYPSVAGPRQLKPSSGRNFWPRSDDETVTRHTTARRTIVSPNRNAGPSRNQPI